MVRGEVLVSCQRLVSAAAYTEISLDGSYQLILLGLEIWSFVLHDVHQQLIFESRHCYRKVDDGYLCTEIRLFLSYRETWIFLIIAISSKGGGTLFLPLFEVESGCSCKQANDCQPNRVNAVKGFG